MEIKLLQDIAIIFGLAILVLQVCHRIKLPAIIGFLVTGALVGPHGLHLLKSVHEVELLAEIGVVLLLFTIGLEFSLKELFRLKRQVLIGGSLQVFLTIIVTTLIFIFGFDLPVNRSVFIGFLMALSSTAIVLRLYQERAELDSPHGENILAILIFQDVIVVLLMLLTPFLAGAGGEGFDARRRPGAPTTAVASASVLSCLPPVTWCRMSCFWSHGREAERCFCFP